MAQLETLQAIATFRFLANNIENAVDEFAPSV